MNFDFETESRSNQDDAKTVAARFLPGLLAKARVLASKIDSKDAIRQEHIIDAIEKIIERKTVSVSNASRELANELLVAIEKLVCGDDDSTKSLKIDESVATKLQDSGQSLELDRFKESQLQVCIAQLPEELRIAVAMRQIENATYSQIAMHLKLDITEAVGLCRKGTELVLKCMLEKQRPATDETRSFVDNVGETETKE